MIRIGKHEISASSPCFIIAELSANHNGDIEIAKETIRAAKRAGADAIKLQTYTPDTITFKSDKEYFKIKQGTIWDGRTLYELYEEAYTPWEWHAALFETAREEDITCFSSPFDPTAVDLLETFDVPAYKIASFEITDIPLITYVASKGKPVIISTGIAAEEDMELAVATCRKAGNDQIILLKTTSQYPAKIEDANLRMIPEISQRFNVLAGVSDHTLGVTVPVVSTMLGGRVIEKHFILDKAVGGVDASFSLDEAEFKEMVDAVRNAEKSLGNIDFNLSEKAIKNREFSRSLFVVQDVKKGDVITKENVRSIRPGFGMHPRHLESILGKTFTFDISSGEPLDASMINQ